VEDIVNNVDGMVKIIFERTTDTGLKYKDVLLFPQEAYDAMTPEAIDALKQARFDRWSDMVNGTAVDEPEPVDDPTAGI
jgi:hypothetical protein